MDVEADLGNTAEQTIRIPANAMRLLRQSYDSREKVLDWWLAIFVTAALVYAFRDQLRGFVKPQADANAGRVDSMVPNQGVGDAFPNYGINPLIYTYNMPPSRFIKERRGPSGTRVPYSPSGGPAFPGVAAPIEGTP